MISKSHMKSKGMGKWANTFDLGEENNKIFSLCPYEIYFNL